jgi:translocation and assembly module TamA
MSTRRAYQRIAAPGLLLATLAMLVRPALADSVQCDITGVTGEQLENVRAALSLSRYSGAQDLKPAQIAQAVATAPAEIRRALQPFGLYQAEVDTDLQPPAEGSTRWSAQLVITAGEPVPITQISTALEGPGETDEQLGEALAALPLRRGEALDHRRYEQAKQDVLEAAQRLGYREARFSTHRVEVDPERNQAQVLLTLNSGRRYVFGPVHYEQPPFTPDYLARYQLIAPGAPFDRNLLSRQRVALSNSGLFREVSVEAGEPIEGEAGEDPALPVIIRLSPVKANRFRGRAGWGTETGAGAQLDWTRRYLGSSGHRFNFGVTAVQERERLAADLRYWIPLGDTPGNELELLLRHESKDLNFRDVDLDQGGDTRIEANLVSAMWRRPTAQLGGFEFDLAAGLNFTSESYDVFQVLFGNLPGEAQQTIAGIIGTEALDTLAPDFRALIAELRLDLRRSDNALFIRRGDALDLRLLAAHEDAGSNISFWQASLHHFSIWPLGARSRVLLRTAVGYSEAESREVLGATFNQMPELYEFRGGGARNVRGYGFETLFPENGITGGRHQLVTSLELEREIIPDWSAAVFVDGGNAFNDWNQFEEKLGAGFGVRWRSPLGPVRLDLGFPLDESDSDFQLYLSVGPEF